jgi:hypothetical protein
VKMRPEGEEKCYAFTRPLRILRKVERFENLCSVWMHGYTTMLQAEAGRWEVNIRQEGGDFFLKDGGK